MTTPRELPNSLTFATTNSSARFTRPTSVKPADSPPSELLGEASGGEETTVAEVQVDGTTWPRDWRAYRTLIGCFFLMFNSWGLVNAYGTFASFYKEHLMPNRDLLLFNLIGSTESFVVLIFSALVGRLLDAGFSRYIIFTGFVLVSVGMFTLSLTSGHGGYNGGNFILIWLTQGFTTGLGMACFFVASSQIASTWFVKRKSFAIGIVASGASIAGLVYPFMIKYLIGSLGWKSAVQAVAGLTCATALFSWLAAIPNPDHPLANGDMKWFSVRRWVDPPAFKNGMFNWLCAAIAFMFFGFYAIFFNLEEWAADTGLGYKDRAPLDVTYTNGSDTETPLDGDALRTFIYLAVMNASSTIGRLASGYLSDKFGALHVHFTVMLTSSLLVFFLWTFASTVNTALAFVVIFGAVSGAVIGLPPATVAHIIQHSPGVDHSRMGHWTGMMYTIAAPFALTGPIIAGHLVTEYNTYLTVQMWSATCLLLASLCLGASIYCMRRGDARNGGLRARAWSVGSRIFAVGGDVEGGSLFRSGWATAVSTRPPTRVGSDDEKEKGDEEKV